MKKFTLLLFMLIFAQTNIWAQNACPNDQTVVTSEGCSITVADYTPQTFFDPTPTSITQDPAPGSILNVGYHTIMFTATYDGAPDKTCSFVLRVKDNTAPTMNTIPTQTVFIEEDGSIIMQNYIPFANPTDDCDNSPTATQDPAANAVLTDFNQYTTVTITATDNSDNSTETTFQVLATDSINPTISCLGDQELTVNTVCQVALPDYRGFLTISDNYYPNESLTVTQVPAPGTTLYPGITMVEIEVSDPSNNASHCSFEIEITDEIPPMVLTIPPQTLYIDQNGQITMPDYIPLAQVSDGCDQDPLVVQVPNFGLINDFEQYTSVTITATDAAQNTASTTFAMTYLDSISPSITHEPLPDVLVDDDCLAFIPDYTATAVVSDNYYPVNELVITQDPAAGEQYTLGEYNIRLTVTDPEDNVANYTLPVNIIDGMPPVITPIGDQTLFIDENGQIYVPDYKEEATITDNCDSDPIRSQDPPVGLLENFETVTTYRVTAEDFSGNISTDFFDVTYVDAIPPTFDYPESYELFVDETCTTVIPDVIALGTVTDNYSGVASITQFPTEGTEIGLTNAPVTLTAVDFAGNESQIEVEMIVRDLIPPVLEDIPSQTVFIDAEGEVTLPDYIPMANAFDFCDPAPEVIQLPAPGLLPNFDDYTEIAITATDNFGNETIEIFPIVFVDLIPPVITCPIIEILEVGETCTAVLPDYALDATATDNYSEYIIWEQSPEIGSIVELGPVEITLTAIDDSGNASSCTFTVDVVDNQAPLVNQLNDTTIYFNQDGEIIVPDYIPLANVRDFCDIDPEAYQLPPAGLLVEYEDYTEIAIIATDFADNSTLMTFDVAFVDSISPTIECLPQQTLFKDEFCLVEVPDYTGDIVTTDNVDPNPIVTQEPLPGTFIEDDLFTIRVVSTDASGNSKSCSFFVQTIDEIPPVIPECPNGHELYVDQDCQVLLPDLREMIAPTDNCDPLPTIVQTPDIGTPLTVGIYNITFLVSDLNNNITTCSFPVTVTDVIPPVITQMMGDQVIDVIPNTCDGILPNYTSYIEATDNCDLELTYTQLPAPGTIISGMVNEITIEVTDSFDNVAFNIFNVAVIDDQAPIITCPIETFTVPAGEECYAEVPDFTLVVPVTDNCDDAPNFVQSPLPGELFLTETEVLLTATDASGNTSTCTVSVVSEDVTPPAIEEVTNQTLEAVENCEAILPFYPDLIEIVDNCDANPTVYQVPLEGTTIGGNTEVTVFAEDASGNNSSYTFIVQITDNTPPVINCVNNISSCDPVIVFDEPIATDNCSVSSIEQIAGPPSGSDFPIGITPIVFEATDEAGNTSTCQFNIEVYPIPEVVLYEYEDPEFCDDDEPIELPLGTPLGGLYAGNGVENGYFHPAIAGVGTHIITYTYTSEDGCSATDEIEVIVSICSGNAEYSGESLSLFPNPFNDKLTLQMTKTDIDMIQVMDYSGKMMMVKDVQAKNYTMDMADLPSGIYFIHVQCASGNHFFQKVIKN